MIETDSLGGSGQLCLELKSAVEQTCDGRRLPTKERNVKGDVRGMQEVARGSFWSLVHQRIKAFRKKQ